MKNKVDLVIYYNGKAVSKLNHYLLDKQDCWENVDKIKEKHQIKLEIYNDIKQTTDKKELKLLVNALTNTENQLQELWGFSKDAKFHRFWQTPKCTCPKMDNEDAYPTGYYNISADCPLHGE